MSIAEEIVVQFSLVPASDAFVPIILDAVKEIGSIKGLAIETDAVSSTLKGGRVAVLAALTETFVKASGSGAHIVQPVLAASGRPSSVAPTVLDLSGFYAPPPSGIATSAQFLLLPANQDTRSAVDAESQRFLESLGLATRAKALVTRVDGDAALVLAALLWLLARTGSAAGETVLQATLVSNSPTAEAFK
jgi:uncharacterized protein YqgV (UPF0045/DUF77 family)